MKRRRNCLTWAVLALFLIAWTGAVVPCLADGGDPSTNPGDPDEFPSTSRDPGSSAGAFEASEQTLEPTSGMLSSFWMILMAMAFQLAL
jgi:hypothetical protein